MNELSQNNAPASRGGHGLRAAAMAAAVAHVAAIAAALLALSSYRMTDTAEARALWLAEHVLSWWIVWPVFIIAAVTTLWFAVALRGKLDPSGTHTGLRLAVALVVVGAALELVAHAINLGYIPALVDQLETHRPYLSLELHPSSAVNVSVMTGLEAARRLGEVLGTGLAPLGFAAGIGLALPPARDGGLGTGVRMFGWLNVGAGAAMAAGTFARKGWLADLGAAMTLISFVIFTAAIAWSGWARELATEDV